MASNGTNQSELYGIRGAGSDGNSNRNRSMEQYYGGSGNPNLPQFNTSGPGQTGSGGQAFGYSRYQPPMMTGFNNQQWAGAGNPYSYNTPNSYGSNYGGGNFYTPYQSSAYGGGAPNQNPLPLFGRGSFPSFQGQGGYPQQNPYGQSGMGNFGGGNRLGPYDQGYGRGNLYNQNAGGYGQFGTKPWQEGGGYNSSANKFPEYWYKPGFGGNWGPSDTGQGPPSMGGGAPPQPQYTQAFSQMLGMGY